MDGFKENQIASIRQSFCPHGDFFWNVLSRPVVHEPEF